MGVGVLGVADHDVIQMTNLHRQILYTEADVGKRKADVAREKLQLINSIITIQAQNETINQDTVARCCDGYDLILDCTDNYESRIVLDEYCHTVGKPLVFGAGLISCLMVNEVAKIVLGIGEVLSGSILTVNVLNGLHRQIKLTSSR